MCDHNFVILLWKGIIQDAIKVIITEIIFLIFTKIEPIYKFTASKKGELDFWYWHKITLARKITHWC